MKAFKPLMCIDGKWVGSQSGKTMPVINPAEGEKIVEVPEAGPEDADLAVKAAQKAFEGPWSKINSRERGRLLHKLSEMVRLHVEDLAALETENTGKPIKDSREEAETAADCFEYYAGAVNKHFGETIPVAAQGLDFTLREPLGVCALIVPWNYPIMIASWKLAPALACGNTVVLKPASLTPLTALRLAQFALEVGFPPGVLNVVTGPGASAGEALACHPLTAKISFTGETKTGAHLLKLTADKVKRVSLELGGKSPNIIFEDADLSRCIEKTVFSVFSNAGQDCCARSRAFVHIKIYDKVVDALIQRTRNIEVGNPFHEDTEMGPLISAAQREKVLGYVELGKQEGAKLSCGGTVPLGALKKGYFLTPAILEKANQKMRVVKEEIFGPVLCVIPFRTEKEVIQWANQTEYGLSGSVWTQDVSRALRVARAVKSGVISVNSSHSVHLEAPFGGYKESGLGRELGMKALDLYSEVKNIFIAE